LRQVPAERNLLLRDDFGSKRVFTQPRPTALSHDDARKVKDWADSQVAQIEPQAAYIRALRDALPEDGIFVNELTQVGYLARIAFPVHAPRTYIGPGYQGTLGYGVPVALGAAVGGAGRRVISITGDGGFGWNMQELATAKRYKLPVTIVVFNDGHYGNVRAIQKREFGAEVAVDLSMCSPPSSIRYDPTWRLHRRKSSDRCWR
jgi:acetolactate synthase-1/2/3 large subunit